MMIEETTVEIWGNLSSKLRHFILKRVSNEDIAQDILQDVFLKIHSKIESLRDKSKIEAWIYQITRNSIIDHYRRHRMNNDNSELMAAQNETENDDQLDELSQCVKSLVDGLPDKYRSALILTEYQGFTQEEMGEKLGLSISGAKSRVQRARQQIKEWLVNHCHRELDQLGFSVAPQSCCQCCCQNDDNSMR